MAVNFVINIPGDRPLEGVMVPEIFLLDTTREWADGEPHDLDHPCLFFSVDPELHYVERRACDGGDFVAIVFRMTPQ